LVHSEESIARITAIGEKVLKHGRSGGGRRAGFEDFGGGGLDVSRVWQGHAASVVKLVVELVEQGVRWEE